MGTDTVRTGMVFPTYPQSGFYYYLVRTLKMAKRPFSEPGTLAHYTHRLTGLILAFYLVAHIMVVSQAAFAGDDFDSMMKTLHQPFYLILDWLLWGAASFHAFNGVRIILFDFEIMTQKQDQLVWAVIGLTLVSMVVGLFIIWPEVFP